MRLKKAKDFFINFNKSPHQIGKELYDYLKDDLRDQFLTISDLADVQYAIQNGKLELRFSMSARIDQLGLLILGTELVNSIQTKSIYPGRVFTRIPLRKYP
jgi:hypothetical protein